MRPSDILDTVAQTRRDEMERSSEEFIHVGWALAWIKLKEHLRSSGAIYANELEEFADEMMCDPPKPGRTFVSARQVNGSTPHGG